MADKTSLKSSERRKAEKEGSLNAVITHEVIRRAGDDELRRPSRALAWSGLAAGLSMGFSLVAEGVIRAHLPDAGWAMLVGKLGYPVGFLIVIMGSQQLFTENTLTAVVPALSNYSRAMLKDVGRLWGIVLTANILGTHIFAWAVASFSVLSTETQAALGTIGTAAMEPAWGPMFVRAIFAGWLIALMVWMLPGAQRARFAVIVVMTWLVGAAELPHIIAGSADVLYLVARGDLAWSAYLWHFFVPTLLGNTVGGVMMVTGLNHAQVVAGDGE